jgi:hypothetical protein
MADDDIERQLAATPAQPEATRSQRNFVLDLLDECDITLDEAMWDCYINGDFEWDPLDEAMRDCYVNGDFEWDPDKIDTVDDLTVRQASVLIDYLKVLRHAR